MGTKRKASPSSYEPTAGDKVALVSTRYDGSTVDRIAVVVKAGARVRLSDGSEWYQPSYSTSGDWRGYGSTRGHGIFRVATAADERAYATRMAAEKAERDAAARRRDMLGRVNKSWREWDELTDAQLEAVVAALP